MCVRWHSPTVLWDQHRQGMCPLHLWPGWSSCRGACLLYLFLHETAFPGLWANADVFRARKVEIAWCERTLWVLAHSRTLAAAAHHPGKNTQELAARWQRWVRIVQSALRLVGETHKCVDWDMRCDAVWGGCRWKIASSLTVSCFSVLLLHSVWQDLPPRPRTSYPAWKRLGQGAR